MYRGNYNVVSLIVHVRFYQPEHVQRVNGYHKINCFTFSVSVCLCVRTYHVRNIVRHTLLYNCGLERLFGGL